MGYSIYAIVPKENSEALSVLEKEYKPPSAIINMSPEWDFYLRSNRNLSYISKSHLRKGKLIGFDYAATGGALRIYIYAIVTLIARELGLRKTIKDRQIPVYYYDGTATPIFESKELATASGLDEYDILDQDGIPHEFISRLRKQAIERKLSPDDVAGITSLEESNIRTEINRLRTAICQPSRQLPRQ